VAVTVLGAGHPLVAHLVGACAVEVEFGRLLRFCLGWIERWHAAGTGGWSGKASG
jgi:hypothetical protein